MQKIKIRALRYVVMLVCATLGCVFDSAGAGAGPDDQAPVIGVPDVFVPGFWDPAERPDRPDLGGVTSIRFITEDDDAPFGFLAGDGTLMGFDVDLARALCEELQIACTIQVRRYDTMVAALKADAADAAIASLAITPQAMENVDFTSPYYRTPARFVARRDGPSGDTLPETVAGRRIGVLRGTAHEAYLRSFFSAASPQSYGSPDEVRAALRSGAIDLIFGDGIGLAQWLQSTDAAQCCVFVGGPFTESRFFGDGAGIAVRKGNGALRGALDYALARLAARGTYGDLYLKYFPIGVY